MLADELILGVMEKAFDNFRRCFEIQKIETEESGPLRSIVRLDTNMHAAVVL